ncbi:taste receptor type 2 member 2-like [Engystomops pustulosus]|uniref:taste receptor type 2 member 2-like n=1 Tax=Engystomops pustulosus TaxID=76066 RepID=UPI003AFB39C1
MASAELILLIVGLTLEFVVGMALNMNILLVYVGNLRDGLPLIVSEKVYMAKALVNVSLNCIVITESFLYVFCPLFFLTTEGFLWIIIFTMFLISYSYWLMALLCVYYCTAITSFGLRTLVWLKTCLSSHMLHILFGLGLYSLAISCPVFWFCDVNPSSNATLQSLLICMAYSQNVEYRAVSSVLSCFLPFTIAFISTVITSWSLIHHMWTMKKNNGGFSSSKFQTQLKATRTMILFLLVAVIFSAAQMYFNSLQSGSSDTGIINIAWLLILFFPIIEAAIIVQSNSKLKKTLPGNYFRRKRQNQEAEI